MNLAPLVRHAPPGFEIVLADVGSAGGLKERWAPARAIVSGLLFEPREGGEVRRIGRDTLYPVALGAEPGRATLNVTALANMSSTLQPNRALLETYRKKGAHTQIVSTFDMPVDTLDALVVRERRTVDALKVDTQGSELTILEGARNCLRDSVLAAEIEVSFFHRYADQPVAGEVIAFMADHGFELIDLYRLKRYRRLNRAAIGNVSLGRGQRAGRLAYGDAFFMLEEKRLIDRIRAEGEAAALKAIVALLVYGKADLAAHLFDDTADLFAADRRAGILRYLRGLRRRFAVAHHMLDYLGRHV